MKKYQPLSQGLAEKFVKTARDIKTANYFQPVPGKCEWGPRIIADYEFIYNVRGESAFEDLVRNESTPLFAGDLLLIPPHTKHIFSSNPLKETIISCIHFSAPKSRSDPRVFKAGDDPAIFALFRKCVEEMYTRPALFKESMVGIIREIWVHLSRLEIDRLRAMEPPRLKKAVKFIEDNYTKQLSRGKIAEIAGITPQHLDLLFRKYARTTPMEMVEELRIRKARSLLGDPARSVNMVSRDVGYEDALYFSKVFKKKTGMPPRQFRSTL